MNPLTCPFYVCIFVLLCKFFVLFKQKRAGVCFDITLLFCLFWGLWNTAYYEHRLRCAIDDVFFQEKVLILNGDYDPKIIKSLELYSEEREICNFPVRIEQLVDRLSPYSNAVLNPSQEDAPKDKNSN